jgi:nucleoside-diphosphate-sugar epimerase
MKVFLTGATGWIGSEVAKELLRTGHQVLGLARSDKAAEALVAAGVTPHRGALEDLESLKRGASLSDGVIHVGFVNDFANFAACCETDRRAIEAIASVLEKTNRPFVIASALGGINPTGMTTEEMRGSAASFATFRLETEQQFIAMASRGIRTVAVRPAPSVHGPGDKGFISSVVRIAKEKGTSAYIGDGSNRWAAVHRLDVAKLFCLALEKAPPGSILHGVGEEGIPFKDIAACIGRILHVPPVSISPEDAGNHFTWLCPFVGSNIAGSSAITQKLVGWKPEHSTLLADLESGAYLPAPPS